MQKRQRLGAHNMVVDIRYHLASLVAVFLSLGLGILIGTSLAGSEGLALNEEWLSSLERELEQLQTRRNEAALRLQEVESERDVYARFAESVSQVLLRDALVNERAAIVLMGTDEPDSNSNSLEAVRQLLEDAGASITSLAHVKPSWNERTNHFLSLLTSELAPGDNSAGALLARTVTGIRSDLFSSIDSPSISLQTHSFEPPTFVTFVVTDPHPDYIVLLEQAAAELAEHDVVAAIVSAKENEDWRRLAEVQGLPFVSHVSSPLGRVSLVHLLAQKQSGIYGHGSSLQPWPESLFATEAQH